MVVKQPTLNILSFLCISLQNHENKGNAPSKMIMSHCVVIIKAKQLAGICGPGVYDLGDELIGGRGIVQQSLWKSGTESIIDKNLHLSY